MSSCSHRASANSGGGRLMFRYQHLVSRSGRLTVVVLREPDGPGELLCDGEPMIGIRPVRCSAPAGPRLRGEISAGEWLADDQSGLMLTSPYGGSGILTFDGRPLRPPSACLAAEARETETRR